MALEAAFGALLPNYHRMSLSRPGSHGRIVTLMMALLAPVVVRMAHGAGGHILLSQFSMLVGLLELLGMGYLHTVATQAEIPQVTYLAMLPGLGFGQFRVLGREKIHGHVVAILGTGPRLQIECGGMAELTLSRSLCHNQSVAVGSIADVHWRPIHFFLDVDRKLMADGTLRPNVDVRNMGEEE